MFFHDPWTISVTRPCPSCANNDHLFSPLTEQFYHGLTVQLQDWYTAHPDDKPSPDSPPTEEFSHWLAATIRNLVVAFGPPSFHRCPTCQDTGEITRQLTLDELAGSLRAYDDRDPDHSTPRF